MNITRQIFEEQCKRRFGATNPERMHLDHWEWMVRRGCDPYGVRKDFGLERKHADCGPDGCSASNDPDWCFYRYGMTRTPMPDGRIICIAGEHEDYYDPDFCIYNDVIVLKPEPGKAAVDEESGRVEIYGYPESVFPPTDFHSATLTHDRLVVIGRLGYYGTRVEGTTPILTVDPITYRIQQVVAIGPAPGWVYGHHASFNEAESSITIRGGHIHIEAAETQTRNVGAHRLFLDGLRWEVISLQETHRRFVVEEEEGEKTEFLGPVEDTFRLKSVPNRWLPPEDRGVSAYAVDIEGVRVSFQDLCTKVQVLIEGDLSAEVVDQVLKELTSNLQRDTKTLWTSQEVAAFRY